MQRSPLGAGLAAIAALGCAARASAPTVAQLVTQVVGRAEAGDLSYFTQYLDKPDRHKGAELVGMICASGMPGNWRSRLDQKSGGRARLNYHFLEKGCHFQIDLEEQGGQWAVKRIWFCR